MAEGDFLDVAIGAFAVGEWGSGLGRGRKVERESVSGVGSGHHVGDCRTGPRVGRVGGAS